MSDWYLYKFDGGSYCIYYKSDAPINSTKSTIIHRGSKYMVEHALGFIHDIMRTQYGHILTTTEPFLVINDHPSTDIVDQATILHMQLYRE